MHRRYDEATAILTTAHLSTMSTQLIARAYRTLIPYGIGDADNMIALTEELSACMGFKGASGGQMLDLARVRIPPHAGGDEEGEEIVDVDGTHDRTAACQGGSEQASKQGALTRMMRMKTSSFFRIALLSAVYVCSPARLNDDVAAHLRSVSDNLGLAFQTFDDFDDAQDDFDDARERANNCVNVIGAQASYERFTEYAHHSVRLLQELDLYNGVIQEFLDMMHNHILRRMEAMRTH